VSPDEPTWPVEKCIFVGTVTIANGYRCQYRSVFSSVTTRQCYCLSFEQGFHLDLWRYHSTDINYTIPTFVSWKSIPFAITFTTYNNLCNVYHNIPEPSTRSKKYIILPRSSELLRDSSRCLWSILDRQCAGIIFFFYEHCRFFSFSINLETHNRCANWI
jgi:hypothetical protein